MHHCQKRFNSAQSGATASGEAPLKNFYFSQFEHRKPPDFPAPPRQVLTAWHLFAGLTVGLGIWYLFWRWSSSLNHDALWFAIPVALAETSAFLGTLLFFYDIWDVGDTAQEPPASRRAELGLHGDGPIRVDVMITTYDEDPELVRHSVRDAKRLRIPENTAVEIHVLDDGNRPLMAEIARQEHVTYHARDDNRGYKAGNLRNALLKSGGDFVAICDADTRVFPSFIENTLGYFSDPLVAWVQTPHWFYDIPEGRARTSLIHRLLGVLSGRPKRGEDPFLSDPGLFFDVIQRRRNRNGASFCCGAGSIHRREAVFAGALDRWDQDFQTKHRILKSDAPKDMVSTATAVKPYLYHVSEDILTSIYLHASKRENWRSVYHPRVEARMLSPWGMAAWSAQKLKYAGGTFDIALRHNPLLWPHMAWRTKLHYAATFWSYFSIFGVLILLVAPVISLFTGIAPIAAYSTEFFVHLLPLLFANEVALVLGCWGHDARRGALLPVATIGISLRAFFLALRGKKIAFDPTPKEPLIETSLKRVGLPLVLLLANIAAVVWASVFFILGGSLHTSAMLIANLFWAGWNIHILLNPIKAAFWRPG